MVSDLPDLAAPHAHFGCDTGTSRPHQVCLRATVSAPAFGVLLQLLSCFNTALTACAQTKNNLYEHGVERGLGCIPGFGRQL